MGQKHIQDYPFLGHYDTWILDLFQDMYEQNHSLLFLPEHSYANSFKDTTESFKNIAIHLNELHDAVSKTELADNKL